MIFDDLVKIVVGATGVISTGYIRATTPMNTPIAMLTDIGFVTSAGFTTYEILKMFGKVGVPVYKGYKA